MKIYIVTYYYSNNYGALLQAHSLISFIKKFFPDAEVEFVRYTPKNLIYAELYKPLIRINIIKIFRYFLRNINFYKWRILNNLEKPLENFFISNRGITVYGSDEIWNFDNSYFGFNPFYFGYLNKTTKIAYSASIGKANIKNLSKHNYKIIHDLLKDFKFISVRDTGSHKFVKKILKINPVVTLDPTLLEDDNLPVYKNKDYEKKIKNFALVYGDVFTIDQINLIKRYCNKKKLKVVSVGFFNKWSDTNDISAGPNKFLNYIHLSDIIFTSMFHGIMLSVKFKKQFWYNVDEIRENKVSYFVSYLGLNHRNLKKIISIDDYLDYVPISKKLKIWQKKSKKYLLSSIKDSYNDQNRTQ